MNFNPRFKIGRRSDPDRSTRRSSSPQTLAQALLALGKLSRRQIFSVRLEGRADVAVLAALAEYLFDLKLIISLQSNSAILYTNCQDYNATQLEVVFTDGIPSTSDSSNDDNKLIRLTRRTLPVENISVVLKADLRFSLNDDQNTYLGGRIPWENCLESVFGNDFRTLISTPQLFGRLIGCAARIFEAFAKADKNLSFEELQCWEWYFDDGFGRGYLEAAARRFPELNVVLPHALKASRYPLDDAIQKYQNDIEELAGLCIRDKSCGNCGEGSGVLSNFCLVTLAEMTLILCRNLSTFEMPVDLYRRSRGFELVFSESEHFHIPGKLEIGKRAVKRLWTNHPNLNVMLYALPLFTGQPLPESDEIAQFSAISHGGFCAYLDMLEQISLHRERVGRYHVIPGRIELDGVSYEKLVDARPIVMKRLLKPEEIQLKSVSLVVGDLDGRRLEVSYLARTLDGIDHYIRPGYITRSIQATRGQIWCDGISCLGKTSLSSSMTPAIDSMRAAESLGGRVLHLQNYNEAICCIWIHNLNRLNWTEPESAVLLRDIECLSCSKKAAERLIASEKWPPSTPVYIISL